MQDFKANLLNNKIYTVDTIGDVLRGCSQDAHGTVIDTICAFDIETTSFTDDNSPLFKLGTMYVWQMAINGCVVVGRTWEEFDVLCNILTVFFKTKVDKDLKNCHRSRSRILNIWVHNLSFEFQWICKRFKWFDVFSVGGRNVMKATTESGLCFRCSYLLTGKSLKQVGEDLTSDGFKELNKLDGQLFDYNKLRGTSTPLTDYELNYCVNDVKVVSALIYEQGFKDGGLSKIKNTKTSYVRDTMKQACFKNPKYRERNCKPNTYERDEYVMLYNAYMGGFVHCNVLHRNRIRKDVASYDFTSDYPHQLIGRPYPFGKGERVTNGNKHLESDYYVAYVEISNLKAKDNVCEFPLSISKCFNLTEENCYIWNGRIVEAFTPFETCITNIDYQIYKRFYDFDIVVKDMYIYQTRLLPKEFVKTALEFYKNKTTLKGVIGEEERYQQSKANLNSLYGCCALETVMKTTPSYTVNGWIDSPKDINDAIEQYNKNASSNVFDFKVSVFCTAYARRDLFMAIYELGEDYCYCDTDSVKFLNYEKHKDYFERYNEFIKSNLVNVCKFHNLPLEFIKPSNPKGQECWLGVWDFEGVYNYFKGNQAKRYFTFKYNDKIKLNGVVYDVSKFSLTCSGIRKDVGCKALIKSVIYEKLKLLDDDLVIMFDGENWERVVSVYINNILRTDEDRESFITDVMNKFSNGFNISKHDSKKLTHYYIDNETHGDFVDYLENVQHFDELTSISLVPQGFELGEPFIKLINDIIGGYSLDEIL